jgi:hypothetical protein
MRYLIGVIIFSLIFSSCKQNVENNLTVYRAAEEGLQRSNKSISASTELVFQALAIKISDPATKEKAEF